MGRESAGGPKGNLRKHDEGRSILALIHGNHHRRREQQRRDEKYKYTEQHAPTHVHQNRPQSDHDMPPPAKSTTKRAIIGVRMDSIKRAEEPVISIDTLAASLAADFPLIDEPLIIALLSDYAPKDFEQVLPEIREQLALFEAALVPDDEENAPTPPSSEPAPSSTTDMSELETGIGRVDMYDYGAQGEDDSGQLFSTTLGVRSHTTASSSSATSELETASSSQEEQSEQLSPLDFLATVFPHLSRKAIEDSLATCPAAEEGDLNRAIELLLSDEAIRHSQETGTWEGEEGDKTTDDESHSILPPTRHVSPPATLVPPPTYGAVPVKLLAPAKSNKRAHKRTIPLVDTLKRQASPAPSRPHSRASTTSSDTSSSYQPTANAWHTLHSLASYLSEMLAPIQPGHFSSFFHSPNYKTAYSATRASLANAPRRAADPQGEEKDQALELLYGIYGIVSLESDDHSLGAAQQSLRQDIAICAWAAAYDVATVIDLMDLLAEIKSWPGDDDLFTDDEAISAPSSPRPESARPVKAQELLPPIVQPLALPFVDDVRPKGPIGSYTSTSAAQYPQIIDNFDTPVPAAVEAAKLAARNGRAKGKRTKVRGIEHPQNWRTVSHVRRTGANGRPVHALSEFIPSYGRNALPNNPTPGSLSAVTAAGAELSVEECLRRAQAERGKRGEMARQAGRYYRHGSGGVAGVRGLKGGDVAGHYAREARDAEARAREWELKAARGIVRRQVQGQGPMSIDLHYLTIAEAKTVVLETAEAWYAAERARKPGRGPTATFNPTRPLTVVTGVGRHSPGQVGVLGPSVANALEAAGWKVDRGPGGRGYLVVRGRR